MTAEVRRRRGGRHLDFRVGTPEPGSAPAEAVATHRLEELNAGTSFAIPRALVVNPLRLPDENGRRPYAPLACAKCMVLLQEFEWRVWRKGRIYHRECAA